MESSEILINFLAIDDIQMSFFFFLGMVVFCKEIDGFYGYLSG